LKKNWKIIFIRGEGGENIVDLIFLVGIESVFLKTEKRLAAYER